MGKRAAIVFLLCVAIAASGACSAVPELRFADGPGIDAGTDGPDPTCTKTGPEICDDNIDNDCNGRTDCADDACQSGYACVDRPPDGWALAALANGSRPACPSGFGESNDVRTAAGPSGPPTCTCSCGGAGSCSSAAIEAAYGNDAACAPSTVTFAVKAQCQRLQGGGLDIASNVFVKATAGTTPVCNANPQVAIPPLADGRICGSPPKSGGGCNGSQVCAPRASNGYSVCVARSGSAACPGAFPTSHHSGSNATDTRACSACTCTTSPCAGEVKIFSNTNCSGVEALKLTATAPPGTCAQTTTAQFQARAYTSSVSGGCVAVAPSVPSGTLTFSAEQTICCK